MNIWNISKYIMYGLFTIGILWSGSLWASEFRQGDICPQISIIPACYIILACFLWLLAIHLFNLPNKYFYILAIFPISIAAYWTFFQIFGWIECPKTSWWIPMCFISLALFSGISLCKHLITNKEIKK